MPPMMRSKRQQIAQNGEVRPVGPPWQCTIPTLLYKADSQNPPLPWRSMSLEQVVATVKDLTPPELQD
eukprot:11191989-Lingulodinium_polyedra.AAC.1